MLTKKIQGTDFPEFSGKTRGEIKHYVCLEIAREYNRRGMEHSKAKYDKGCYCTNTSYWGTERHTAAHYNRIPNTPDTCIYDEVDEMIEMWAGGSDNSMQKLANKVLINRSQNTLKEAPKGLMEVHKFWARFIKIIYDLTQEHFRRNGIRYVTLYRGMRDKFHTLKPLSSFSACPEIAKRFYSEYRGTKLEASVPVRFIASTYFTGYGCAQEYEYVVLGMGQVIRHMKAIEKGFKYA